MYYSNSNFNNTPLQYMQNSMGHIRVLHAVPDAPNVDVYANGLLLAKNLSFGQNTDYMSVPAGTYNVSLYVTGTTVSPVLSNTLMINASSIFTIAAVGMLSSIGFLAISDSNMQMKQGNAMIRFAHLSPNAPAVDITLPNGTILFSNVSFKEVAPYITVPAMNYTLQVRVAGTPTVVLTVPNINLSPDNYYTAYAIGLVGKNPELQAKLLMDY